METICARWLEAVGFVTIRSAERRAPSAEAHDRASGAGAVRPAIAA